MTIKQNLLRKAKKNGRGFKGNIGNLSLQSGHGFHEGRYLVTCSVLLCIKNFGKYINVLLKKNHNLQELVAQRVTVKS